VKRVIFRWFSLLVSVITLPALMIPALPASAAGTTVDLMLLPATQNIGSGDIFILTVQAQCGTQNVGGVSAFIDFNPAMLEVVDTDPLSDGIQITPGTTLNIPLENNADNTTTTTLSILTNARC
jgi:hypothetical protein